MQMVKNSKKIDEKRPSNRSSQNIHQLVPHRDTTYTCTLAPSNAHKVMRQLELAALQSHARGNPKLDHLISLTKLNVQYAIRDNTIAIGITADWLRSDDSISIFNVAAPGYSPETIPAALQPTALQRTKPHHPWLDIFPFPRMRDNMIAAEENFDDEELCRDIQAFWDTRNTEAAILVWGFPWDPMNWEVTEAFVRKWGWIVRRCEDLLHSTNRWRRMRGEKRLVWE